jgi:hypothetical protein
VQNPADYCCRCSVTLLQRMAVNPQSYRRIGVTKSAGHRTDVDASADQLGGREVSEVVKPYVWGINLIADTDEK